jgi:putative transposase
MPTLAVKNYLTDLTDAQWELIRSFIVLPTGGRPKTTDLRRIINAILYPIKTGCHWRMLPHDFPPEGTVRDYFHRFKRDKILDKINEALRQKVRVKEGRDEEPSLSIIDSQSIKAARTAGERGYDAGKKINGIKRHFLVDVLGLIICIVVHAANRQEREGAKLLLQKAAKQNLPRMIKVLADGGYTGEKMKEFARQECGWELETVKRNELHKFKVMPKRWVVERTIGWTMNWRGLCRHYDYGSATSETKVLWTSVFYMSKRLTDNTKNKWEIDEKREKY